MPSGLLQRAFIATAVLALASLACVAAPLPYLKVQIVEQPAKVQGCKDLGELTGNVTEIETPGYVEPLLLSELDGLRYEAYLQGGNVVLLTKEKRGVEEEQSAQQRAKSENQNPKKVNTPLPAKAYQCG